MLRPARPPYPFSRSSNTCHGTAVAVGDFASNVGTAGTGEVDRVRRFRISFAFSSVRTFPLLRWIKRTVFDFDSVDSRRRQSPYLLFLLASFLASRGGPSNWPPTDNDVEGNGNAANFSVGSKNEFKRFYSAFVKMVGVDFKTCYEVESYAPPNGFLDYGTLVIATSSPRLLLRRKRNENNRTKKLFLFGDKIIVDTTMSFDRTLLFNSAYNRLPDVAIISVNFHRKQSAIYKV